MTQEPRSKHCVRHNMEVFRTVKEFRGWRRAMLLKGKTIGLVPTMGALHAGHISLVEQASKENDAVVISIFVNPAQFAPHEDFDAYPRTWETDREKIEMLKLDHVAVFMPTIKEMYPRDISLDVKRQQGAFVEVLGLSEQLEGISRPHFFRGVATVVTKLFNIIQPERAYFGQKDIQQTVVLKALVRDLHIPLELIVSPTIRESDGLALSSRNAYLEPSQRSDALSLWHALKAGMDLFDSDETVSAGRILKTARDRLARSIETSEGRIGLEYLEIVNSETLKALEEEDSGKGAILVGAIRLQSTERTIRLIDNVILGIDG